MSHRRRSRPSCRHQGSKRQLRWPRSTRGMLRRQKKNLSLTLHIFPIRFGLTSACNFYLFRHTDLFWMVFLFRNLASRLNMWPQFVSTRNRRFHSRERILPWLALHPVDRSVTVLLRSIVNHRQSRATHNHHRWRSRRKSSQPKRPSTRNKFTQ